MKRILIRNIPTLFLLVCIAFTGLASLRAEEKSESARGYWATLTKAAVKNQSKSLLRRVVLQYSDDQEYGLTLPPKWKPNPTDQTLVIFVHGYNSTPERNRPLIAGIEKSGYRCATFKYPNDHRIAASGKLLSKELTKFAKRYPLQKISLVTHSMGGLVARECLENPKLDPGNVTKLIMLAPPSHGSMLAYYAMGADILEHGIRKEKTSFTNRLKASIADGLSEAVEDMKPGSKFLKHLNSLPRNKKVRYSILLGDGAIMDKEERAELAKTARQLVEKIPYANEKAKRLETRINQMDELLAGKGDGAVSIERGKLQGVADIQILHFRHLTVTNSTKSPTARAVHLAIHKRLSSTKANSIRKP